MEKLVIEGGRPLSGAIQIHGAKNAALPILAASLMASGVHTLHNVPELLDIEVMLSIVEALGCRVEQRGNTVTLDTTSIHSYHIPDDLMKLMRSSIFLMGPLLALFGSVQLYHPGGCAIGERKIDFHLRGLQELGVEIEESGNRIICKADRLQGADIMLDFPSVGATENLMMAAAMAEGVTTIFNAAREPEIQDLQHFLNKMGAEIIGAGTDTITIKGVQELRACSYRIIPDRIVAGTFLVAAAATKGTVSIEGANPVHLTSLMHVLKRTGAQLTVRDDLIQVSAPYRPKAVERIVTAPYPSFPTDLQSQIMVLLSLTDGHSIIKETIFEGRFKHVDELCRMGADIRVDLNSAFIHGVPRLYGATVEATDLRAGAALIIAGLAAHGTTVVEQVHHVDRGYDRIELMLKKLGAQIYRISE
ncbi:UDP-N-acetylglucosamine 1-carboxyvinyltransferase [Paenibacillus larvae]|uniref:UDP-N-acetylglucosamine 1-carboxyvinyltransferase n=1 Tax=Paenibacillus larvae subsp. larvae DSM 25430 TaxID=697284 RepID=V9W8P4_9BACL|nr:UDP-N-acetylglucosamine 1-carboxyvinyltransferase [Paenibacillus larvae]AHD06254.1 UDP-N-acetylglucosamine 1-carboxyvinyltransferase [Paenibacillus larvae subsp. larvae DSM 25430]AVG12792.1 UDP-N-acetylglucosamine 1-carboxyvinyltransferase [Paenibacillus larvae subsp. larvae DSM 25430]MDR5569204.1 UDP-N-acetylglucosamine 1-carboxyvinyltransferase [Paenibacillus larvae]MDR5596522.1 UDP-N-acetylglucosamine 1-carboxyvinyltransferase [Paenibacillus larvae]